MASALDICNTALAWTGSDKEIASISPPDGSVDAGRCARFYPIARRRLLTIEGANWGFAKTRSTLATATNPSSNWAYAYVLPSSCIKPIKILAAGESYADADDPGAPFEREGNVLLTNEAEAVLVFIQDTTDTTKFTPSFESALAVMLASYLIGMKVKGVEGVKASQGFSDLAMDMARAAATADANASSHTSEFTPSHTSVR